MGNSDNVVRPMHYAKDKGIQPIEFMRKSMDPAEFRGFCMGNVIKYVSRHMHKNGVEDLQKAKQYLEWLIKEEQKYEGN